MVERNLLLNQSGPSQCNLLLDQNGPFQWPLSAGAVAMTGAKKLLFTVSPTLYLLMFIAIRQGKFTHYSYLLD